MTGIETGPPKAVTEPGGCVKGASSGAVPPKAPPQQGVCLVCGEALGQGHRVTCSVCQTVHHQDCWLFNGGCAVYGCEGSHRARVTGDKKGKEGYVAKPATMALGRFDPLVAWHASLLAVGVVGIVAGLSLAEIAPVLAGIIATLLATLIGNLVRERWVFFLDEGQLRRLRRITVAAKAKVVTAIPFESIACVAIEGKSDGPTKAAELPWDQAPAADVRAHAVLCDGRTIPITGWSYEQHGVSLVRSRLSLICKLTAIPLHGCVVYRLRRLRRALAEGHPPSRPALPAADGVDIKDEPDDADFGVNACKVEDRAQEDDEE